MHMSTGPGGYEIKGLLFDRIKFLIFSMLPSFSRAILLTALDISFIKPCYRRQQQKNKGAPGNGSAFLQL